MQVEMVPRLAQEQLGEVLSLVRAAIGVDKVSPLSEQALLSVRAGLPDGSATAPPGSRTHFLTYAGTNLVGYAQLERGPAGQDATGEVVVDPGHRLRGVGTMLIRALEDAVKADAAGPDIRTLRPATATLGLWSHGDLEGARALALRDGYSTVRELWQMRRSLRPDITPLPVVSLPQGFRTRHFVVGQDENAWLRVNSRAFEGHPEQGRMTRHDLDQRLAEPWFDARGFILIEDRRGGGQVLAASHWTKVAETTDPKVSPPEGEVYVVGVDPAYQGLGLGRAVTVLGLAHLREAGLTEVMLYVEADNPAAIATYTRLGFARFAVDVMYSRTVQTPVQG